MPSTRLLPTLFALAVLTLLGSEITAKSEPLRGLSIAAPAKGSVARFTRFIEEELAARNVNTLLIRIDYRFEYQSRPELVDDGALSLGDVKQIVAACRRHDITLIPQINLLGHQSWHTKVNKLLEVYPEFDETPHVVMPETYEWPNDDGLYCKSYCPLHPDVHDVVFDLVDEIVDAFEANAFHAGMDEVFYIGDDRCPRCAGKDKAVLFANEVEKIRAHLAQTGKDLWIWGDRLLDGVTTGLGMWEASANDTHRAIDLISKDVVICDWHYERAEPTAAYFAMKGFTVATCAWNKPQVALAQLEQFHRFKQNANPTLAKRHIGLIHTVWSSADAFFDAFENGDSNDDNRQGPVDTFKALFKSSHSED